MARGKKAAKLLTPEEKLEQALVPVDKQPYLIPKNWCWVRLSKLYEINPKVTADDTVLASFVPMERIEAGMTGRFTFEIQSWGKARKNHTQFADGDVAFAKISPCFENQKSMLVQGLTNGIGGGTTELIILRQAYMNQKYTFLLISTEDFISRGCATYSGTVGQQRISMDFVKSYLVPIPPLPEQYRIVGRIESLFAKLDEAKEKAQAVVDGFELRKAAILHKAFTGELTTQWRKDHPASPNTLLLDIEEFSHGWTKKDQQFLKNAQSDSQAVVLDDGHIWIKCTIGAISRVTNGSTPSRRVPEYWNGTIYWVSSGEVRNNIIENTNECITQKGYDNSSIKLLPAGTVLIAMIGEGKTRGQSAILAIDATINQNIAAVVVDHNLVASRYIWYWFQMNYTRNREKGSGTGPQALNCQRVRELDFFVPNLPEQEEIVRILDRLLAQGEQAKSAAEAVLSQIDTMKKAILAHAFRGELGTNDPAEEWAGELVREVLKSDVPKQPNHKRIL